MKVKITVWTVAADDDHGTDATVYATEAEALEGLFERARIDGAETRTSLKEAYLCNDDEDDSRDFYEELSEHTGTMDTYSIDVQTLETEIDATEPKLVVIPVTLLSDLIDEALFRSDTLPKGKEWSICDAVIRQAQTVYSEVGGL